MTKTPALGDLIRESRLALGYSLGQLATKVDRTAATVRTWERGEAMPDAESRAALESVLDIDSGRLESLLTSDGVKPADAEVEAPAEPAEDLPAVHEGQVDDVEISAAADSDGRSDEEETSDGEETESDAAAVAGGLAAVAVATEDAEPVVGETSEELEDGTAEPHSAAAEPAGAAQLDGVELEGSEAELPLVPLVSKGLPVDDEEPESAEGDDTDDTLEGVAAVTPFEVDPVLIDEPTEAVVVPVVAAATGVATQTRSVVTVSEPKEPRSRNPLRAFFDPQKRWLYWLRGLLTLAVAMVLLLVLVWAAGELFDALGEVLDSIEPTEVDDGGIDALVRFRTLI